MKKIIYKYQTEYENTTECFWETSPAKYVLLFSKLPKVEIRNSIVLDVGAGEGKNAVFLANMNANVTAVDVSEIALSRFARQPNYENCSQRITIIKEDIRNLSFRDEEFDIIVAYGVLHCLDSKEEIFSMVGSIKKWLKKGGYFVCATFTDEIPIPKVQTYLNEKSLLSQGELEGSLDDFEILNSENSIISEIHPTTNIEHKHSIVRIIAQKHE